MGHKKLSTLSTETMTTGISGWNIPLCALSRCCPAIRLKTMSLSRAKT
jgi:hypothetical protein